MISFLRILVLVGTLFFVDSDFDSLVVQSSVSADLFQKRRLILRQLCKILPLRRGTVRHKDSPFYSWRTFVLKDSNFLCIITIGSGSNEILTWRLIFICIRVQPMSGRSGKHQGQHSQFAFVESNCPLAMILHQFQPLNLQRLWGSSSKLMAFECITGIPTFQWTLLLQVAVQDSVLYLAHHIAVLFLKDETFWSCLA